MSALPPSTYLVVSQLALGTGCLCAGLGNAPLCGSRAVLRRLQLLHRLLGGFRRRRVRLLPLLGSPAREERCKRSAISGRMRTACQHTNACVTMCAEGAFGNGSCQPAQCLPLLAA